MHSMGGTLLAVQVTVDGMECDVRKLAEAIARRRAEHGAGLESLDFTARGRHVTRSAATGMERIIARASDPWTMRLQLRVTPERLHHALAAMGLKLDPLPPEDVVRAAEKVARWLEKNGGDAVAGLKRAGEDE